MFTLHDGEAKLNQMFVSTAFSMLPYIILSPVLIALSHLLSLTDAGFYYSLTTFMWVWVLYQFYRQINVLNNYTFPQTVAIIILTICGMLAIGCLLVLLYFLAHNLFLFVRQVYMEICMRIS